MEKIKLGNSPEIMRRVKTRQKLAAYIGVSLSGPACVGIVLAS